MRERQEEISIDDCYVAEALFKNLVSSNLIQVPNQLQLSCQCNLHLVIFKHMIATENDGKWYFGSNTNTTNTTFYVIFEGI